MESIVEPLDAVTTIITAIAAADTPEKLLFGYR